jgi:DNA-binding transcriptional LysR family regulator
VFRAGGAPRRILAEIEAAQTELSQTVAATRGVLRISLPIIGAPVLPILADFKRHYPEVDLAFTDRRVYLIEEGFDAVTRSGEVQDSRLMGRRPRVNQLYSLILAMAIRPAQAPATRLRTEASSAQGTLIVARGSGTKCSLTSLR